MIFGDDIAKTVKTIMDALVSKLFVLPHQRRRASNIGMQDNRELA
jgi:hypothetical protein